MLQQIKCVTCTQCCPIERTPEVDSDPFDVEADDPKNCHALESCLWELQVGLNFLQKILLQYGLDPQVTLLPKGDSINK